jgi:hypothetical protein
LRRRNACSDGNRKWTKRSNIEVIFSDPEFAFAGCTPADAEKDGHQLISATAESGDIGKLHLAGDDSGFGEFWADIKTMRLISAGLLCNDAANLIHLPAYAIDHEHTIHQLEDAEFYHPTKIEIGGRDWRQALPKAGRSNRSLAPRSRSSLFLFKGRKHKGHPALPLNALRFTRFLVSCREPDRTTPSSDRLFNF